MLIEGFFKLIGSLLSFILSLIPEVKFEFDMPDMTYFQQLLGMADYFIPVGSIIACIGVIITVQNAQFILKVFNFIYKKIPFIGG